MTPLDRFFAKVDMLDNGCWEWTASCNQGGYGRLKIDGKLVQAHRFAYEQFIGPIPVGLDLDHLCRVRHCVNPAHLEAVTGQINVLRGNGFAARQAAQTHCLRGHLFDEENTYRYPNGRRGCRMCLKAQSQRWKAAHGRA